MSADFSHWRILSVDDESSILETMEMTFSGNIVTEEIDNLLQNIGATTATESAISACRLNLASSGKEAYKMVAEALDEGDPYAVILMDMRMPPGWDGLTAAEKIIEIDPAVKIIFVSAYSDYRLNDIRKRIGLDFEFLNKPVDFGELKELVKMCAERWSQVRELEVLKKEREQAARRTALILKSIAEGIIVLDQRGAIQMVNQKLEEMVGCQEGDLTKRSFNEVFHNKNGSKRSFFDEIAPTVVDRLQRLHDLDKDSFHQSLRKAPIPIVVVNLDQNQQASVFTINNEMEELLGYQAGTLQQNDFKRMVFDDDYEVFIQILRKAEHGSLYKQKTGEIRFKTFDGDVLSLPLCVISVICGSERHLIVMPVVAERMDQVLFNLMPIRNIELEEEEDRWSLINVRGERISIRLSGSPLYDYDQNNYQFCGAVLVVQNLNDLFSAESERRANQSKDEFLASMSHELRTPLTTVIGNGELILGSTNLHEIHDLTQGILVSGRQQLAQVNDILDLTQLDTGQIQINKAPFCLLELISDVEAMFTSKAINKDVRFEVHTKLVPTHRLVGDSQRVRQVLFNVVGNAIKFTDRGRVTLTTWATESSLFFKIEDTGIGISPDGLDKLFNRFEQADGTISRRYTGNGLGLYISEGLVSLMGGEIDASSQLGKGALFQVRIPYQLSQLPVDQVRADQLEHKNVESLFDGRVLVVEDTELLQMLVRKILESMGVEVSVANNGLEGVEASRAESFDLIFMDMQMPVMDGIEATKMIRAEKNDVPIVALTANVMQKHRDAFFGAGCNGFLEKPVNSELLQQEISKFLKLGIKKERSDVKLQQDQPIDTMTVGEVPVQLKQAYIGRISSQRGELNVLLQQRELSEIYRIAHSLKGSSCTFGFPEIADLGGRVCEAIDAQKNEKITECVTDLMYEMDRVVAMIEQEM